MSKIGMSIYTENMRFTEWWRVRSVEYLRHSQLAWEANCGATAIVLLYKSVGAALHALLATRNIDPGNCDLMKLFCFAKADGHLEIFRNLIAELNAEFEAEQAVSKPVADFAANFVNLKSAAERFFCAVHQSEPNLVFS